MNTLYVSYFIPGLRILKKERRSEELKQRQKAKGKRKQWK